MYNPHFFESNDRGECLRFMRAHCFATLVTAAGAVPTATHLPFIIEERGDKVVLVAHMARANTQWKDLVAGRPLVIFQGPHAYVSPIHYDEIENLPTWNYVAVHASGAAEVFEAAERNLELLEKMIAAFDPGYFSGNWLLIDREFKLAKARGVVGFEITIDDLQGKKKLSQNKSKEDARRVIDAFSAGDDPDEERIAAAMKEIYDES